MKYTTIIFMFLLVILQPALAQQISDAQYKKDKYECLQSAIETSKRGSLSMFPEKDVHGYVTEMRDKQELLSACMEAKGYSDNQGAPSQPAPISESVLNMAYCLGYHKEAEKNLESPADSKIPTETLKLLHDRNRLAIIIIANNLQSQGLYSRAGGSTEPRVLEQIAAAKRDMDALRAHSNKPEEQKKTEGCEAALNNMLNSEW